MCTYLAPVPNVRHSDKRQISLWIDVELKEAAEKQAIKVGLSATEYIAQCIDAALKSARSTKTKVLR